MIKFNNLYYSITKYFIRNLMPLRDYYSIVLALIRVLSKRKNILVLALLLL